jgi:HD-like signal output (HDOD) protein
MNAPNTSFAQIAATERQALAQAFNQYLFTEAGQANASWGEFEHTVYHQVSAQIENQSMLSSYIPSAPTQLIELMGELEREEANFDRIERIIIGDPRLVGEIIKVTNSPLYRPKAGEISSVEKAITMIGLDGISQITSTVMMRKIIDISSLRFKNSVKKVWSHCLKSGEACKMLGGGNNGFQHYLLGLIHDVGKVAIFSCFIDQTKEQDLPTDVCLAVIARLMEENSFRLSTFIAAEWGLSDPYLITIGDFEKLCTGQFSEDAYHFRSSELKALELGTLCAMIHSLVSDSRLGRDDGLAVLAQAGVDELQADKLFSRFDLAEGSVN